MSVSVNAGRCLKVGLNGCNVCLATIACLHHNVANNDRGQAYIIDPKICPPCLEANNNKCAASRGCAAETAIAKTRQGHESSGLCSDQSAFDVV